MITSFKIFESKTQDELYHFTNIFNAIGIVNDGYISSHYDNISMSRNKNMNKEEPPQVQLGVRFVFDWDKILEDYNTKPFVYSVDHDDENEDFNFEVEEEELILIKEKKKSNLKIYKYIISIDIMIDDIQRFTSIRDDWDLNSFKLLDPECTDINNIKDFGYLGVYRYSNNFSEKFFMKCKEFFENKNYKVNLV